MTKDPDIYPRGLEENAKKDKSLLPIFVSTINENQSDYNGDRNDHTKSYHMSSGDHKGKMTRSSLNNLVISTHAHGNNAKTRRTSKDSTPTAESIREEMQSRHDTERIQSKNVTHCEQNPKSLIKKTLSDASKQNETCIAR